MSKEKSLQSSPQLVFLEQQGVAVAPTHKQIISLYKKSEQSNIPFDTLFEVYKRGFAVSLNEQDGFNRVNSFIAGGKALDIDKDLIEKRGLWDNIWAKRKRIASGSGEHMRKPGSKGAPSNYALTHSDAKEEYTGAEKTSKNTDKPSSRFDGTTQLTKTYKTETPGYTKTIKRVVKEQREGCPIDDELFENIEEEFLVSGKEQYEDWQEFSEEAEYQGHKVSLGKPFLTPGGPAKRAVYVKNDKGNVVKVNFGDPNMTIKKSDPARRKSFRARHHCDTNPGPRWKARYWSCRAW